MEDTYIPAASPNLPLGELVSADATALPKVSTVAATSTAQHPAPPIFDVGKVEIAFGVNTDFAAAQVANNVLVLGLHPGRIMRIDLDVANEVDGWFPDPSNCVVLLSFGIDA